MRLWVGTTPKSRHPPCKVGTLFLRIWGLSEHRNPEKSIRPSKMSADRRILAAMMAALDEHQGSVPEGLYLTLCNHLRDLHRCSVSDRPALIFEEDFEDLRGYLEAMVERQRWMTDAERREDDRMIEEARRARMTAEERRREDEERAMDDEGDGWLEDEVSTEF